MSANLAILIAMGCLFAVGLVALIDASHLERRWRIGPILLCASSVFWFVDRLLLLGGEGVTIEQTPWRPYLPALVAMGCALTLAGLLWRHRAAPKIQPDRPAAKAPSQHAGRVHAPPLRGARN